LATSLIGILIAPGWRVQGQTTTYSFITLAGTPETPGSTDSSGGAPLFQDPNALAVDLNGTVYVADTPNHTIRKITMDGVVTTFAGLAGNPGSTDATGTAARFEEPRGIAVDAAGNLYVGDTGNYTIRKVTPAGVVTTLAGTAGVFGSTDATGSAASFYHPHGVAVDSAGNVYVADQTNHTIRKVTAAGVVTTLAGLAGQEGSDNGTGSVARFSYPRAVAVDAAGTVYVADSNNHTIRVVTPLGEVTTLAGLAGNDGHADDTGAAARFNEPNGIAVTSTGMIFVADTYNFSVRRVTPGGVVTTIAGQPGEHGTDNGTGSAAHFGELKGVAVDSGGTVYVADTDNHTIRRGTPSTATTPSIASNPLSRIVPPGESAILTVATSGTGPFTYQWFQGNSPNTAVPIAGATGSTFTTPALAVSTNYWVRVTNVSGSADSMTATVAVDPALGVETVQNGGFSAGTTGWALFEEPDMVGSVVNGVFRFHRANPTTTASRQAVIFQQTGQSAAAGQPLIAQFQIGNADVIRKRMSVLMIDSDFSDLAVCTFWLQPGAPLRPYLMRTRASESWTNASIYFYAASTGTGDYLLDNVSLRTYADGSPDKTECLDPTAPSPTGGADSANLLTNGDFGTGALPPWGLFGDIVSQITAGVFEFIRPGTPGQPAGVILQETGAIAAANELLTASFELGNSSGVRKRVTVLLHDADFSDLSACTFWLPPGRALSSYVMKTFTTKAWANATLSVYAATTGAAQWIQLDNVALRRTPSAATLGVECIEPAGAEPASARQLRPLASGVSRAERPPAVDLPGRTAVRLIEPVEVTPGRVTTLRFASRLALSAASVGVEVSLDGVEWERVAEVPSGAWLSVDLDLEAYAGTRVFVRFVFETPN
jgi:hypothetical protein